MGDVVDEPADGDRLHLEGETGEKAGGAEEAKIAIAEDGPSRRGSRAHRVVLGEGAQPVKACRNRFRWCAVPAGLGSLAGTLARQFRNMEPRLGHAGERFTE